MKEGYRIEAITSYSMLENGEVDFDDPTVYEEMLCDVDEKEAIERATEIAREKDHHGEVIVTPWTRGDSVWSEYEYDDEEAFHVCHDGEVLRIGRNE